MNKIVARYIVIQKPSLRGLLPFYPPASLAGSARDTQ